MYIVRSCTRLITVPALQSMCANQNISSSDDLDGGWRRTAAGQHTVPALPPALLPRQRTPQQVQRLHQQCDIRPVLVVETQIRNLGQSSKAEAQQCPLLWQCQTRRT